MQNKLSGGMGKTSGFTLIELLLVVGLLAILAVAALAALNPIAAQRKTRDAQRLKDIAALQAIAEQYATDNPTGILTAKTSKGGTNACASTGWMATDMCNYANTLPIDPANKSSQWVDTAGVLNAGDLTYVLQVSSGNYRVCTRLESAANDSKLTSDGGVSATAYEVFNNAAAPACGI